VKAARLFSGTAVGKAVGGELSLAARCKDGCYAQKTDDAIFRAVVVMQNATGPKRQHVASECRTAAFSEVFFRQVPQQTQAGLVALLDGNHLHGVACNRTSFLFRIAQPMMIGLHFW
jgi:hypothetical protein